ncbi:uncharacterized protein N7483_004033 [Penicillium malachiteum]|uniref:uncharacterized protein n=1 Tax=Penicillium malachiteum TaxID=1324776 RepID=UPI002548636D|nr:uncharacterized protein N7483_004033 [Penicillium malachiteum]KAJ5729525.1 hypothetical protein N7483_004033 [Penicillium malachiteum]
MEGTLDDVTAYVGLEDKAARTIQRKRECTVATELGEKFKVAELQRLQESSRDKAQKSDEESGIRFDESDDNDTSPARKNWQRAVNVAIRAGGDDNRLADSSTQPEEKPSRRLQPFRKGSPKMIDLQYFLEMVDAKHRHGSNLRAYHTVWKNSPSNENFFYWLDHGEGKDLDLPHRPRQRLEKQEVRYLTPEERWNYMVKIDDDGLFRWAKNNDLVETDSKRFKDSLHGVVRIDDETPTFQGNSIAESSGSGFESETSSASSLSPETPPDRESNGEAQLSTQEDYELDKAVKKFSYIKPEAIYDHFASSLSVKDGMWIFVADTSFRIYIGIKEPGAFQHSSFLRGGRIAAAGMLKIRHGQLRSLAPLSGHYRPHVANFRAFHHSLQERGVDLSRISISKSYAVLAGIEGYTLTKRKVHSVQEKLGEVKQKLHPGCRNGKGFRITTRP